MEYDKKHALYFPTLKAILITLIAVFKLLLLVSVLVDYFKLRNTRLNRALPTSII